MNIGGLELGILGVIALVFFGASKLKSIKGTPDPKVTKRETNPMASFQNNNSDMDNTPIGKPEDSQS